MKAHLLTDAHQRMFAVVFDAGDEVVEGLGAFAREHDVTGAGLTAIGAFESVTIGYFDVQSRDYQRIAIAEQVEVLSLVGNVAVAADGPRIHAHVVVGKSDGTAHGGHLLNGRVRPTLEVIVTEMPVHLRRRTDPLTGLALIDLTLTTERRP
jgi:predicted DNA-binding protein with PD1-like motif